MQRALLWLCSATRPLYLVELSEAIVVQEGDVDLDSDSPLLDLSALVSIGQSIFDYDPENGLITLSHASVKTFLKSAYVNDSDVAYFKIGESKFHLMLMRTCLTYLRLGLSWSDAKVLTAKSVL